MLEGLRYETPLGEWLARHPAAAAVLPSTVVQRAGDEGFSLADAADAAGWPREELLRLLVQTVIPQSACGSDCAGCVKGDA